jgi:hypothetical protein
MIVPCCFEKLQDGCRYLKVEEYQLPSCIILDSSMSVRTEMLVTTIEQYTDKAGAGLLRKKPSMQEFLGLQYSEFYGRT